jgi:chromosome segregation ATPase
VVASFRQRHSLAERRVSEAEHVLKDAEGRLERVKRDANRDMSAREWADRRVEEAQAQLERAKEERDAIEDEARRAGVLPGDLR